jgi:Trypsin-co-occurring domain 1
MVQLVRYELIDGASIVVEERDVDGGGFVGRGQVVEAAQQTFEEAIAVLRPATSAVLSQVRSLLDAPNEVELELSFSLRCDVGLVVAKSAAEGAFKLSLKWKNENSIKPG